MLIAEIFLIDINFEGDDKMSVEFTKSMKREFKMSMIREIKFFIGHQVSQFKGDIFIGKIKYIKEILKIFPIWRKRN